MSLEVSIDSALTSVSDQIAIINDGPEKDLSRFSILESKLGALGQQITGSDENLIYLELFTAVQEQFLQAKATFQKERKEPVGMGSRSVLPTPAASSLHSRLGRTVPTGQVAKGTPLPPGAHKVLGSINQFTDRDPRVPTFSSFNRNTCPCTSLAFVSHFLNHGNEGLDSKKVDQLILIGQDRFLERIAIRREALKEVEIPPELMDAVRGTMIAPAGGADEAFKSSLGERPHAPDAFFLVDHDPRMEGKLTGALNQSIINQAKQMPDKTLVIPLKVRGITFHARFEVTEEKIKSSLCSPEGVSLPGTESELPNTAVGIATTSKTLVGLMTTECRKIQLEKFINQSLVPLTELHPSRRAASTITINGQICAIGVEASGSKDAPIIKVTLFDSHGNRPLNGSGSGFVYQVNGARAGADILLRMLNVQDKEIDVRGFMSEAQIKMIRGSVGDLNEVGSYIILPREELVPFPEARVSDSSPSPASQPLQEAAESPSTPLPPEELSLVNHDLRMEEKLTEALNQSIIDQAMHAPNGTLVIPLKARGVTFHARFEVTQEEIRSSLSSLEGVSIPGTECSQQNSSGGTAATSKALVKSITNECHKIQVAKFINKKLASLAESQASPKIALDIAVKGKVFGIEIDATASHANPTIKITTPDAEPALLVKGVDAGAAALLQKVNA